jgi:hypothetical protein
MRLPKPPTVEYWAQENHPDFVEPIKILRKAWQVHQDYLKWIRINTCQICGKDLTIEDDLTFSPTDFTITCNDHREYRKFIQVDKIKQKLGFA